MLRFLAKTFYGLETVLEKEIQELGGKNIQKINRGVFFDGSMALMYKANYCLRTAIRIYYPLESFKVKDGKDIYTQAKQIDWTSLFTIDKTFSIEAVVHSTLFNHSNYCALKVKDAIADKFRDKLNARPNVNSQNADIRIYVHIDYNKCAIYLDSSGETLNKRGYRTATGAAPLNEVLAAGIIQLAGYTSEKPLIEPMCGSGTIAIEAAMIARNMPPQKNRDNFSFMHWKNFDNDVWQNIKEKANEKIIPIKHKIIARDIAFQILSIARENAKNAEVYHDIRFEILSFENSIEAEDKGLIITNLPFGKRLDNQKDWSEKYKSFSDVLKQKFNGFSVFFFTSNFEAMKAFSLRPSKQFKLFNGAIECKLYRFDMYAGSQKSKYSKKFSKPKRGTTGTTERKSPYKPKSKPRPKSNFN